MNFHRISKMSLPFAIVGVLLVVPSLASAATHPFLETFGSAAQPSFGAAKGIAVDQATGDVYVIDQADQTVSRFKPDGTPANFSALGTNVIDTEGSGTEPRARTRRLAVQQQSKEWLLTKLVSKVR